MRLYVTRSAFDLSYFFLVFFIVGLILTCLYLVNENAVVGYIGILVELLFAVCMLAAKIYLDNCGPYSEKAKRTSGAASNGLTIQAKARLDMNKFLSGTAGAPFPKMMQAEESHAAAHLLLDCQLEFSENSTTTTEDKNKNNNTLPTLSEVEDGRSSTAAHLTHTKSHMARLHLSEFVELLETCLENAELDVYKRQSHAFASFKQRRSSLLAEPEPTPGGSNLCFIPCKDGYASCMWLPESSTLAVDLVGAAPETITKMSAAAEMFCRELKTAHPGAKIVASAVSRLPNF
jgi:hypothetical protein